jgi:hemerythrin
MEELRWSPEMSLGAPAMDKAHKAFVEELAQLVNASDHEFGARLSELIARIERDFREEEALMEKIDFPGLKSHREQHARVLSALHHVIPDVMQGDCASARKAIELLPQWFLFHLSTMDAVLAVALDLAGIQTYLPASPAPQVDIVQPLLTPSALRG